jgi:hypothetical protein
VFTVVHAQISSTSRVLRSAWTVVSRGDCISPLGLLSRPRRKRKRNNRPRNNRRVRTRLACSGRSRLFFSDKFVRSKTVRVEFHKIVRIRLGTFRREICFGQFGTFIAKAKPDRDQDVFETRAHRVNDWGFSNHVAGDPGPRGRRNRRVD